MLLPVARYGDMIVDQTGLKAKYDIRLEYLPEQTAALRAEVDRRDGRVEMRPGASLFAALEQQLGLKLVPVKGSREVIVIDRIEKPSGN